MRRLLPAAGNQSEGTHFSLPPAIFPGAKAGSCHPSTARNAWPGPYGSGAAVAATLAFSVNTAPGSPFLRLSATNRPGNVGNDQGLADHIRLADDVAEVYSQGEILFGWVDPNESILRHDAADLAAADEWPPPLPSRTESSGGSPGPRVFADRRSDRRSGSNSVNVSDASRTATRGFSLTEISTGA